MTLPYSLITGRTAANKSAGSIRGASKGAGTAQASCTYLHADRQIVVELITVWTTAFVTANCIDAATVAARRSVAFILVYALIVIKMLDKAVRASTAIAAHEILTTVFATSIVCAFVMIGAKSSSMIQLKTSGTNALKTAQSVNTLSRFRTNTRLFAFVYIMACVSLLIVAFLTAASVTSWCVYAILLAQVIPGRAFVKIPTADTVGIQDETGRTRADKTALGILTVVLARLRR